ncbi:unnamed protein product [Clonostachys rhizophaga]|uniref:Uncharacterized protein n=1 Tax=Clonostachys rhizophaga TaxID=160324 RepID=A0A9N9W3H8_9HYPO|nr:unnamed protein product [Clonostachys rhizophaga]
MPLQNTESVSEGSLTNSLHSSPCARVAWTCRHASLNFSRPGSVDDTNVTPEVISHLLVLFGQLEEQGAVLSFTNGKTWGAKWQEYTKTWDDVHWNGDTYPPRDDATGPCPFDHGHDHENDNETQHSAGDDRAVPSPFDDSDDLSDLSVQYTVMHDRCEDLIDMTSSLSLEGSVINPLPSHVTAQSPRTVLSADSIDTFAGSASSYMPTSVQRPQPQTGVGRSRCHIAPSEDRFSSAASKDGPYMTMPPQQLSRVEEWVAQLDLGDRSQGSTSSICDRGAGRERQAMQTPLSSTGNAMDITENNYRRLCMAIEEVGGAKTELLHLFYSQGERAIVSVREHLEGMMDTSLRHGRSTEDIGALFRSMRAKLLRLSEADWDAADAEKVRKKEAQFGSANQRLRSLEERVRLWTELDN